MVANRHLMKQAILLLIYTSFDYPPKGSVIVPFI